MKWTLKMIMEQENGDNEYRGAFYIPEMPPLSDFKDVKQQVMLKFKEMDFKASDITVSADCIQKCIRIDFKSPERLLYRLEGIREEKEQALFSNINDRDLFTLEKNLQTEMNKISASTDYVEEMMRKQMTLKDAVETYLTMECIQKPYFYDGMDKREYQNQLEEYQKQYDKVIDEMNAYKQIREQINLVRNEQERRKKV